MIITESTRTTYHIELFEDELRGISEELEQVKVGTYLSKLCIAVSDKIYQLDRDPTKVTDAF